MQLAAVYPDNFAFAKFPKCFEVYSWVVLVFYLPLTDGSSLMLFFVFKCSFFKGRQSAI
jgi:hypothetical protein